MDSRGISEKIQGANPSLGTGRERQSRLAFRRDIASAIIVDGTTLSCVGDGILCPRWDMELQGDL